MPTLTHLFHSFIHSFPYQIVTEHLLHPGPHPKGWGTKRTTVPSHRGLMRETETTVTPGGPSSGRDICSPLAEHRQGNSQPGEGVPEEVIPEPGLEGRTPQKRMWRRAFQEERTAWAQILGQPRKCGTEGPMGPAPRDRCGEAVVARVRRALRASLRSLDWILWVVETSVGFPAWVTVRGSEGSCTHSRG